MAKRLTDIQRVILSAAAARKNGNVFPIPDGVGGKAGTHTVFLMAMLARGLLTERAAGEGELEWREDEQTGKMALAISPVGLATIGIESDAADKRPAQPKVKATRAKPGEKANARPATGSRPTPPKTTKQALVISMLRRQNGASVDEIVVATDWASHSVRGFMSGALKKRLGLGIISEKRDGVRRYFVGPLRQSRD